MKNTNQPRPTWKLRRRAVFGSMLFGMAIIVYTALKWDDTSFAETLALGGFGLIGTVVAAYIGGAVYEDVRLPQYIQERKKNGYTEEGYSKES